MAREQFPGDDDAESAALEAAGRATDQFGGFGWIEKLAATYVRLALKTYMRTKARRNARERKLLAAEREGMRRKQTARGTYNGRPIHPADSTPADPAGGIDAALALLPTDLREAVKRHHIDGETVEAIAHSLGVDVRTVQRRLKHGRETLTEKLLEK